MKKALNLLLLILPALSFAQSTFTIKSDVIPETRTDNIPAALLFNSEIKKFSIKIDAAINPVKNYRVKTPTEEKTFATDGNYTEVAFSSDVRDQSITIHNETGGLLKTFKLGKPPGGVATTTSVTPAEAGTPRIIIKLPPQSATGYITSTLFPNGRIKDIEGVGLRLSGPDNKNSQYFGEKYIHLFFDQNGNSLIRSIPVGISRANYVVHVVYLVPAANPASIDYKINQSPADIEEGVVIRGEGDLMTDNLIKQGTGEQVTVVYEWRHFEILLTGSSQDILFDIVRNTYNTDRPAEAEGVVVALRKIPMKRIYHGSLDMGLLDTHLANPEFSLVDSDVDPSQKVVKKTNDDHRTFASAMYTFYISPVVLLEKLFAPKRVRNYRLEGRNFVDDHRIYERIYPTFGIGLSDRLLDNYFIGGKWEFIRGGSIFLGYHNGKVNILEVEDDFKFSETYMTQAAFDLRTNTKRKGGFCFGLNLDVRIITNLFQTGVGGGE